LQTPSGKKNPVRQEEPPSGKRDHLWDQTMNISDGVAIRAANASARQSYSVIVVEDRKIMKKLCGFPGSKSLLFCVDFNRIADMAGYLNNEFQGAKSLGIDSLFTNGIHRGDAERVFDILELPQEYCFPLIALILGYPSEVLWKF